MFNLRDAFFSFFESKHHVKYKESSLIPSKEDATLLFVNSGMVQFKKYLKGIATCKDNRVVTCQPCLRVGGKHDDIENVGRTHRHHTLFEMLGNFSFNGYFKQEAIDFAWEFVSQVLKFDIEKIWITVYLDDNEAYDLWSQIINTDRIVRLKENFWSSGSAGPCGYCSEIFYDRGDFYDGNPPGKGDEGDRFIEIWNLVFVEFSQDESGSLTPLKTKGVDCGMGLERVQSIIENTTSAYEGSIFKPMIEKLETVLEKKYEDNTGAFRIIVDHARSVVFLISQGVIPSNVKRGYILRKLIRRSLVEVYKMQQIRLIFVDIYKELLQFFNGIYPDLIKRKGYIIQILQNEFEMFTSILSKAENIILSSNDFDEKQASVLYETHGVSFDISNSILKKSKGITLCKEKFDHEYKKHVNKSLNTWKEKKNSFLSKEINVKHTKFIGYEDLTCIAKVLYCEEINILGDLNEDNECNLNQLKKNKEYIVAFDKTSFYATGGGQLHDIGKIFECQEDNLNNTHRLDKEVASCISVQRVNGVFLHKISSNKALEVGRKYFLEVDKDVRHKTSCNHTATHILHYVIHEYFDSNVVQKGSYLDDKKLRYDFNLNSLLTQEELMLIESKVNEFIFSSIAKNRKLENINDAFKRGVTGLFDKKYDENVFVVEFGKSKELCGGTHVDNTSQLGMFKIISHTSIGSGLKRIEAVTNEEAYKYSLKIEKKLDDVALSLGVNSNTNLTLSVESLKEKLKLQKNNNFFVNSGGLYIICVINLNFNEIKNIIPQNSDGIYFVCNFDNNKYSITVYSKVENVAINVIQKHFKKSGGDKYFGKTGGKKEDLFKKINALNNYDFLNKMIEFFKER